MMVESAKTLEMWNDTFKAKMVDKKEYLIWRTMICPPKR